MYFSFDEFREIEPNEIIKAFQELTGNDVSIDKTLLLFDEVQKSAYWENKIKARRDYPSKTSSFVKSGSPKVKIEE